MVGGWCYLQHDHFQTRLRASKWRAKVMSCPETDQSDSSKMVNYVLIVYMFVDQKIF